jgi:hypothetical protein
MIKTKALRQPQFLIHQGAFFAAAPQKTGLCGAPAAPLRAAAVKATCGCRTPPIPCAKYTVVKLFQNFSLSFGKFYIRKSNRGFQRFPLLYLHTSFANHGIGVCFHLLEKQAKLKNF